MSPTLADLIAAKRAEILAMFGGRDPFASP